MPRVEVEFYGIARLRAGVAGTAVEADGVSAALSALGRQFPFLEDRGGKHYLFSLNGERFVRDRDEPLRPNDKLLVFSADAGG